jgi:uncharacterized protein (DUF58 family)
MAGFYLSLLIVLLVVAAVMRDDFALTLIYLFVGAFVLGTWWSRKSINQLECKRKLNERAFYREKVNVKLQLRNRGWLPILWINLRDSLPVALSSTTSFKSIISLGPYEKTEFTYTLQGRKRGYYPIGPLTMTTGDILGLGNPVNANIPIQHLTVYPKIIPLTSVEIPSRSPQGTLRHTQPIFADPTRVLGKREYVFGDSLRAVDWKSTAITGRLQVKLFEPSIALETMIFLNLNAEDYPTRHQIDSTELAIVVAASLANWVISKQQTVGIKINGSDPLTEDNLPQYIPPRKGQAHLIRMLETLARIQSTHDSSLTEMIQRQRYHLSWGTTLIVITGQAKEELIDELYQARRSGKNTVLILVGPVAYAQDIRKRAEHFGIEVVSILNEHGLDIWRK